MPIESAFNAGRQGLMVHGEALAVLGNNVANANTTAFKRSRTEFEDLVSSGFDGYKTTPESGSGGGVALSRVRVVQTPSSLEATNRPLDFGIDGDGMFILDNAAQTNQVFSRNGIFKINQDGLLANSEGLLVQGYAPTDTAKATLTTIDMLNPSSEISPTSEIQLFGNLNAGATIQTVPVNPATFNEISAVADFITPITVVDSLGASHSFEVAVTKTGAGAWTAQAYIDGGDVGGTVGAPVLLGTATLTYNGSGTIDTANKAAAIMTLNPAYGNGANAGNFTLDLGAMTQFSAFSNVSSVIADGIGNGEVQTYTVNSEGQILALLDNDNTALIGTIALADFPSFDGLRAIGNTLYKSTELAGELSAKSPNVDGLGTVRNGNLELSNVDLATEFTDLVILQRGFQANSQIIQGAGDNYKKALDLMR